MYNSPFIGICKSSEVVKFSGNSHIFVNSSNILGLGNQLGSIDLIMPYGDGCIPPDNSAALFIPIGGSGKTFRCIGFTPVVPKIPHEVAKGESWKNSQKYILLMQNDGIRAYRNDDQAFNTTLPNGESFVQMMINRINELQAEIDYLKTHKHEAGTLLAPNGQVSGETGAPTSPPPEPATMNKDLQYLQGGKALINDSGVNYE